MKVYLRQIGTAGLEFCETIPAEDLNFPDDMARSLRPLDVCVFFQRAEDELLADCQVTGRYRLLCSRCLAEFEVEKTDRFELSFDITSATEYVEFFDEIRDEIILAAAVKPLCRPDCKGICAGCGADLNNETCKCNKSEV